MSLTTDRDGHLESEGCYYGAARGKVYAAPKEESAFIRCASLEACKEAFTLKLDRALAAAGVPREDL